MAKIDARKAIQKRRTADEMRKALALCFVKEPTISDHPDTDDSDVILRDCIEELLEARAIIEDMRGFVTQWHARFTRR